MKIYVVNVVTTIIVLTRFDSAKDAIVFAKRIYTVEESNSTTVQYSLEESSDAFVFTTNMKLPYELAPLKDRLMDEYEAVECEAFVLEVIFPEIEFFAYLNGCYFSFFTCPIDKVAISPLAFFLEDTSWQRRFAN